ncbi:unnamed protein product [Somion occarium]|uniref:Uncharacterized protein n=1 Tax=Somion occarium TaxID=3059160 RepID=A0ABP1DMJ5_9APHY
MHNGNLYDTPGAGPSRVSSDQHGYDLHDDDEDNESTPRLSAGVKLAAERNSPLSYTQPVEDHVGRLRSLLARAKDTPSPTSRAPVPSSPSDKASDFEPVNYSTTANSIASQSLKELFSNALREPGQTPRKFQKRRNSIDASEVEDSPRLELVHKERAYNKGKRRSMSDEEAELASVHSRKSDTSYRSSAAAYDALRQKLTLSTTRPPPPSSEQSDSDVPMEVSGDTATIMKQFGSSTGAPLSTSTPMRSLAIPSHLQMHSNLLDQDSEMQRAMNGVESSEAESAPKESTPSPNNTRRLAFPSGRRVSGPTPARPLSWSSHSKSHTHHNLPLVRRASEEIEKSSSRASSSMSNAEFPESEKLRNQERNWNRPNGRSPAHIPTTPEHVRHHHSHSSPSQSMGRGSPMQMQSRRLSAASLQSLDDDSFSRSSSLSSKSEYRERQREAEEERNKLREQQWNKPPLRTRASSTFGTQSLDDRMRTYSQPARPDSAASYLSPDRGALSRQGSLSSVSGSSRATSPSSSHASRDVEKEHVNELERVAQHEREHNWNSPRPKWFHRRSVSPSLSPVASSSGVDFRMSNGSTNRPGTRAIMDESFPGQPSLSQMNISDGSFTPAPEFPPRAMSSPSRAANGVSRLPRLSSPQHHQEPTIDYDSSRTQTPGARFGFQFPSRRPQLPPFELDADNAERPSSRPSSRLSMSDQSKHVSHIPVRSSPKRTRTQSSPKDDSDRKKGIRRNLMGEFSEVLNSIPPPILDQPEPEPEPVVVNPQDEIHGMPAMFKFEYCKTNEEPIDSDQEPISSTNTPTAKPVPLPSATPPGSPPKELNVDTIKDMPPNRNLNDTERPESPPPTPPPVKPDEPRTSSVMQTPPRPSFRASTLEFQTPSPPKFLPELPGPPPDSSGDELDNQHTPSNFDSDKFANMTTMKTPRPPGAWITTPAAQFEKELISRPSSTPPERIPSLLDTAVAKRPATMSKASATPLQTPAPPGAWVATPIPTTARRKSILKVRFDVEAGNASSDGFPEIPVVGPKDAKQYRENDTSNPLLDTPPNRVSNGPEKPYVKLEIESSVDDDSPSPYTRPVKTSKSPTVRVLDAFGRETAVDEQQQPPKSEESMDILSEDIKRSHAPKREERETMPVRQSVTPRSRSTIRIVDAMGREVQEASVTPDTANSTESEPSTPLSHNEALARVRETIAHLAHDLDDVDSCDELAHDENRIDALEDASKAARNARKRISESLQLVKTAEDDLRSKFGSLREGMHKSKLLPTLEGTRVRSWSLFNTWTICLFVIIQVAIFIAMYRHSNVRARKLFLSTYYDPFNPDIFLHITNPENVYHLIPYTFTWSPTSIPDAISREGWRGVTSELWGNVTCLATDIQRRVWDAWSARDHSISWESWPPT